MQVGTESWHRWMTWMGVAGLYLFVFSTRPTSSGAYLGLFLMDLAFLLGIRSIWPRMKRDPLVLLIAAFTVYLLLRAAWAVQEFPETKVQQLQDTWNLFHLWLFVVPALWLGGDTGRVFRVLIVALAGLLVGVAIRLNAAEINAIQLGLRTGFGMPALAFGLFSGTGLIGLTLFAPRILGSPRKRSQFILRLIGWLTLFLLLGQGLILTQSRGTWLYLLLLLPPLAWLRLRALSAEHKSLGRTQLAVIGGIALILSATLIYENMEYIKKRMLAESGTTTALITGDYQQIPINREDSLSIRFHLTKLGLEKWLERPWLGWGPGATRSLLNSHQNVVLRDASDLHNTYLELLVRIGIVGGLFFLAGAWLIIRAIRKAYREGALPYDLYLFLIGVFLFLGIWSLTDFRMNHSDWKFFWLLFGGIAYTFQLHAPLAAGPGSSNYR